MTDIVLRPNIAPPGIGQNIILNGHVAVDETITVAGKIYWRWADDPTMKPEYLARGIAGQKVVVPFEMKGRPIILSLVAETAAGLTSVTDPTQGQQILVEPPTAPILSSLSFDTGPDETTGTIVPRGGKGNIKVLRRQGSEDWAEIAELSPTATSFVDDTYTVNGTYEYKLIQDGIVGEESMVKTVAVDIGSSGTGSPPSDLLAVWDLTSAVDLSWTNNGGTGDNIIERKIDYGVYTPIGTVADTADLFTDLFIPRRSYASVFYYRVSNQSVAGFSNEYEVVIPGHGEMI